MAGAGYKLFVNGNTLSASDLNTYVQQQTVMVFASASARTTALSGVLAEGMVSYRTDSHVFEIYNGSAWVSAGSTSPLTTKGDIWGYDTANNRIPIGTNNQVLTADSTQALGVKWATPASGSMTLLSTTTLSGATTTISSISGSYLHLYAYIYGVTNATAAGAFTCKPNGTANIGSWVAPNASTVTTIQNQYLVDLYFNGYSSIRYNDSNNAWGMIINNYANTSGMKPFSISGGYLADITGHQTGTFTNGFIYTTSAISSLVFANAGGNLSTGTVLLYGVN